MTNNIQLFDNALVNKNEALKLLIDVQRYKVIFTGDTYNGLCSPFWSNKYLYGKKDFSKWFLKIAKAYSQDSKDSTFYTFFNTKTLNENGTYYWKRYDRESRIEFCDYLIKRLTDYILGSQALYTPAEGLHLGQICFINDELRVICNKETLHRCHTRLTSFKLDDPLEMSSNIFTNSHLIPLVGLSKEIDVFLSKSLRVQYLNKIEQAYKDQSQSRKGLCVANEYVFRYFAFSYYPQKLQYIIKVFSALLDWVDEDLYATGKQKTQYYIDDGLTTSEYCPFSYIWEPKDDKSRYEYLNNLKTTAKNG